MKQKKIYLIATLSFMLMVLNLANTYAQVKIGGNPTTIISGSLLELESTGKALTLPRMTGAQMLGIPSPTNGMLIYNTDSVCICQYRGSGVWQSLCNNTNPNLTSNTIWPYHSNNLTVGTKGNTQGIIALTGYGLDASGDYSHAEGQNDTANNLYSWAIGNQNKASGIASFAANNGNTSSGNYSTSFGNANKASGSRSFASGNSNVASGGFSFVGGLQDTVTGYAAFSVGFLNNSDGDYSITFGKNNEATNETSIAFGSSNISTGVRSISIGDNNKTLSDRSIAIGTYNVANANGFADGAYAIGKSDTVSGLVAVAIGSENTVTDLASVALGRFNKLYGQYNMAIGKHLVTSGFGAYVIGDRDTAYGGGDWNLAIGINSKVTGNFATAFGTQAISTGISSHVFGDNSSANGNYSYAFGTYVKIDSIGSFGFGDRTSGAPNVISTLPNQFNARFAGGYRFFSDSNLTMGVALTPGSTSWTSISDRRAKNNVNNLTYGLNTVMDLRPTEYFYNGQNKKSLGFIAQEVKMVVPEVVDQTTMGPGGDYLGIRYTELIPILTKAIQEQQAQIEELKSQNKNLVARVKSLEKK